MRKFLKENWVLVAILLLAAVLRLVKLGEIPPRLLPDEAALGYNAYSILKTAKDEYGTFLPMVFKSFGDFKPGLYVYLVAPFIATFGLTEFATRLPGAIAGIGAIWFFYLVVKELFGSAGPAPGFPPASARHSPARVSGSLPPVSPASQLLPLLSAFFLAISPWHIVFSRGAWETGVALTFTLAAIYFFLRAIKNKPRFLFISALFFGLTLLTYQGAKLNSILVLVGLLLVFWKKLFLFPKRILIGSAALGLLVSLPILSSLFLGQAGRLTVFSVFSYPRPKELVSAILVQGSETKESLSYLAYHSEPLNFARAILGRWSNHYSGRFLFFEGDWSNPRNTIPDMGVLLFVDIIFLILGFVALARMGKTPAAFLVWYWLAVSPLPAALSRDSIQAVRALFTVVPLVLVLAVGANFFWQKKKLFASFFKPVLIFLTIIYLANFVYLIDQYFVHVPVHSSQLWGYGWREVVKTVSPIQKSYQEIKVEPSFAQPYIYFLFYQKYDPAKYQEQAKLVESPVGDVGQVERLDNICFCPINWADLGQESGKLIVADSIKIPPDLVKDSRLINLISEIKLGRYPVFEILEVK